MPEAPWWTNHNGQTTVALFAGHVLSVLKEMAAESCQSVITSPPYLNLREYHLPPQQWGDWEGTLGLEPDPRMYVQHMVEIFREVRRVLRKDGTLWLNLGDTFAANRSYQVPDTIRGDVGNSMRSSVPAGLKAKDLLMIPARVAIALQEDGWWLRSDIVWYKPNVMPEPVKDRPTRSHEYLYLLSKSSTYFYDQDAVREPHETLKSNGAVGDLGLPLEAPVPDDEQWWMRTASPYVWRVRGSTDVRARTELPWPKRWVMEKGTQNEIAEKVAEMRVKTRQNPHKGGRRQAPEPGEDHAFHPLGRTKRDVWDIPTEPFPEAHFATMPQALIEPCVLAGTKSGDVILDPFAGSGTTLLVASRLGRHAIGIELSEKYLQMARDRIFAQHSQMRLMF